MSNDSLSATFSGSANLLTEETIDAVLQNIEKYKGSTIVLKFGGEMVANEEMLDDILRQAIKLKRHGCNVILVHGGGNQIDEELAKIGLKPGKDPLTGKRMCDDTVMKVSYDTLNIVNKYIVERMNMMSADMGLDIMAMAESGYNGGLIRAEPLHETTRTGNPTSVDADTFKSFANTNKIPVIYPICMGPDRRPLNVNADDVAAKIAIACGAGALYMVTNTPGVWDENKEVIPEITIDQIRAMIKDGIITEGMIAKVEAAISVAMQGIDVVITTPKDGGLFKELFTIKGAGTKVLAPKPEAQPQLNLPAVAP